MNPYIYANGNPVMNVDPSGLFMMPLDNAGMDNAWVNNFDNIAWMNRQQASFERQSFNGNRVEYFGTSRNEYVTFNENNYSVRSVSFTAGGNSTPIKGGGFSSGYFFTTGDSSGSFKEQVDFGALVSTSKSEGFGAGTGFNIDYYPGGRDDINGKSDFITVCFLAVCYSDYSNKNGEYIGFGVTIGGKNGGGAVPGGSFTWGETDTKTATIRDFIKIWKRK